MPQRCVICSHPKRDEINRALLSMPETGESQRAIAERFGLNRQSVSRHTANHLALSVSAAQDQRNALTIVGYASDLYDRARAILSLAERALKESEGEPRSLQAASGALREARQCVELLARLVVSENGPEDSGSRSAQLDAAIGDALQALRVPELPSLTSGVAEAEIVPD